MNVIFDTSVWIEHLRGGILVEIIGRVRGRFRLVMPAVVAAELGAGCRSRTERRVVDTLVRPFRRAGRVEVPLAADLDRSARALSRLRETGLTLKNPGAALLDGLIAAAAARLGALVVTHNRGDYDKLSLQMPFSSESFDDFSRRLAGA